MRLIIEVNMFVLEKTYREDMELSRIRYMEILRENAELKEKVSFQSEALRKNIEFLYERLSCGFSAE